MDPLQHKRFLDYRDRHVYFGAGKPGVAAEDFVALDLEQRALEEKGEEARTDEEQARYVELSILLHRD